MTKQHPLTDEMCKEIQLHIFNQTDEDCMRAAYDLGENKGRADMLEQVIKWAQRNCWCWFEKSNQAKSFTEELKKAMRPQEDNQ